MRPGYPAGVDASTVLYLPFRDGEITDESGTGNAVAKAGTPSPRYAEGAFGDGLLFAPTDAYTGQSRLEITPEAALDITGACTIDFWCRSDDPDTLRPVITHRAISASGSKYAIYVSGTQVRAVFYDSTTASETHTTKARHFVGTSGTGLGDVAFVLAEVPRLQHVRVVFDPSGGFVWIFQDGCLTYKEATALADLDGASGVVQVGCEVSDVAPAVEWVGVISDLRVRSAVDTDVATLSPNLTVDVVTKEVYQATRIDVREFLHGESWTTDGAAYYIAMSGLSWGSFILDHDDIVSVSATTSGGTKTTFTETHNVTDCKAGSNVWCADLVNRRFYSSEDPTGYTIFEVVVRVPVSDKGLYAGDRWYPAALLSTVSGERRMAWSDEPPPTGEGLSLQLARQHPDLPTDLGSESASNVAWTGCTVRSEVLSNGMPWSEAIQTFMGFIDSPPGDDRDVLSLHVTQQSGLFFKVPPSDQTANATDFPGMDTSKDGYVFPWTWGKGHKRLPCIRISAWDSSSGAGGYKFKICAHQIASIDRIGIGLGGGYQFKNVDLSEATFWFSVTGNNAENNVWADCSGYGSPLTSTTSPLNQPVASFGDPEEADLLPGDILQSWLTLLFGLTASDFGSSWAATGARVAGNWRMSDPVPGAADLSAAIQRLLAETFTFLYFNVASETWEWEDVNKADAADYTVTDPDVISEKWYYDRTRLAKKANASALAYQQTSNGEIIKGEATSLDLTAGNKYNVREVWNPANRSLTGFYIASAVDTFLAAMAPQLQSPTLRGDLVLSKRFEDVEIMDVLDIQTTDFPAAGTTRVRVVAVNVTTDGVAVAVASEELLPTDGSSTAGGRNALPGVVRHEYYDGAGQALSTVGAWTAVDDSSFIFHGDLPIPANATHRMMAYCAKTGGSVGDVKLRIYDTTNTQTIATIDTIDTAGFYETTTFANIPTGKAVLELQYFITAPATALTLYSEKWATKEHATTTPFVPPSPTRFWQTGTKAGRGLSTSGEWATVFNASDPNPTLMGHDLFWAGESSLWTVDFDILSATAVVFRIAYINGSSASTVVLFPAVTSGARQFVSVATGQIPNLSRYWFLQYLSNGAITWYGLQVDAVNVWQ